MITTEVKVAATIISLLFDAQKESTITFYDALSIFQMYIKNNPKKKRLLMISEDKFSSVLGGENGKKWRSTQHMAWLTISGKISTILAEWTSTRAAHNTTR